MNKLVSKTGLTVTVILFLSKISLALVKLIAGSFKATSMQRFFEFCEEILFLSLLDILANLLKELSKGPIDGETSRSNFVITHRLG